MPFIRNSKGIKIPLSTAKIAEYISISYREVYNKNFFKYRSEINSVTKMVIDNLSKRLSNEKDSEWEYFDILKEIHSILIKNVERMDVFYAFEDFYNKELSPPKAADKTTGISSFKRRASFDPAWNFYIRRMETEEEFSLRVQQAENQALDVSNMEIRERRGVITLNRSQWISAMEKISLGSKIPLDVNYISTLLKTNKDTTSYYSEEWFSFYNNLIFQAMEKDLRFYGLLSTLELRKMRYELIGGNPFLFSGIGIEDYYDEADKIKTDFFSDKEILNTYSTLFVQFINQFSFGEGSQQSLLNDIDVDFLSKKIRPERDKLIDWRAIQKLKESGSLKVIPNLTKWKIGNDFYTSRKDCYELIQWMYMRLAISLASHGDEEDKNSLALKLYENFSTQRISPTAGMLREAGKNNPNYIEDKSVIIADRYENIWESINETAIGTKWTGTVSLDWREVRAKGSPIKNGLRESGGILPFLETIDTALNSQDREYNDKPVTNIIPLYHKDVEFLLEHKKYVFRRFNSVISIPDLFMKRAKNAEMWSMFDPKIFPEILSGTEEGYLLAESKIKERAKKYPKSYRQKRADKILKKIISNVMNRRNNIIFENNSRAFNILNNKFNFVNGVDGVGSFNVHYNEERGSSLPSHWVKWPSIAINILPIVENDGKLNVVQLKEAISLALYILNTSISPTLNKKENKNNIESVEQVIKKRDLLDFRHTCIGIIGFNEVIDSLKTKDLIKKEEDVIKWSRALFSSFQTFLLTEEQKIIHQQGASNLFEQENNSFFDPSNAINKLKHSRDGSLGISLSDNEEKYWKKIKDNFSKNGLRFLTKTIYAPFEFSASLSGVSNGGIGESLPLDKVLDDQGNYRFVPTPLLMNLVLKNKEELIRDYSKIIKYPDKIKLWHDDVKKFVLIDQKDFHQMLKISGTIRPFLDHGVSFTIPEGLSSNEINNLIEQAWFYGVSTVRTNQKVDILKVEDETEDEDFEE